MLNDANVLLFHFMKSMSCGCCCCCCCCRCCCCCCCCCFIVLALQQWMLKLRGLSWSCTSIISLNISGTVIEYKILTLLPSLFFNVSWCFFTNSVSASPFFSLLLLVTENEKVVDSGIDVMLYSSGSLKKDVIDRTVPGGSLGFDTICCCCVSLSSSGSGVQKLYLVSVCLVVIAREVDSRW